MMTNDKTPTTVQGDREKLETKHGRNDYGVREAKKQYYCKRRLGIKVSLTEKEYTKKIEEAKRLCNLGMSVGQVSKVTGMSVREIKTLIGN